MKIIFRLIKKNVIISIFLGIIFFTSFIALIKYPFSKTKDVYVKVKLGQGLWWANSAQPGIWFLDYLKKGDKELNFSGKPDAEIVRLRYYQQIYTNITSNSPNQFDIYLLVKISATGDEARGYTFKRTKIAVGVPIDFNFLKTQVSGVIVSLSAKKPDEQYVEKEITLTKRLAYPWEYDVIKIGDKYFDGEENIFEITGKQALDTQNLVVDNYGNLTAQSETERRKYVTVNAKIKLKKNTINQYIYGEEQTIKADSYFNLITNNIALTDFYVSEIK